MPSALPAHGPRRITVIGAGVVGIAAAVCLRREGHEVMVIDRLPPGEACSFGNSGAMPRHQAWPMATPGVIWKVPGYIGDPYGPLALRLRHLPQLAPWLMRFLCASRPRRFAAILDALTGLMRQSHDDWGVLIAEAGLASRVRENSALTIYRTTEALEKAWPLWQMLVDRGARVRKIERRELRDIEPDLPIGYDCAVFDPDYRHALDPFRIPLGLADHFLQIGGRILRANVAEIEAESGQVRSLRTNVGQHPVDMLVIAGGAWSGGLARQLGCRVPLESARGYHVTFLDAGVMPRHVLLVSDMRMSLTPMAMGLRLGGSVEFAGLYSAPDFSRPARYVESLRRLYPAARADRHTMWAGDRPMTPDSLPVICRCPTHGNVIFAFGHGQYGLALAAVTGRLVAAIVDERVPTLDLSPFRIERFRP